MASIDNRIVNMEFNNGEFEKRVSDTMKTLAGLDKAIAQTGTQGNGLDAIAKSASGFNLDGMTSAIEGVSAKFIALSTIGITALANLTNKAIDAGLQIAKSLAIAPIASGFTEYELKLNSIQTIMAGSGANLDTVNQKLQELNTYSDQTIYSFADMTSNIGKFTNAGVDLDTSVASIKGIANVAALSGANSEEASRAMYNFAQALSKGYVQLVDWKSIELANMGTTEFKTQLLQAAEAAGTLTKRGDEWVTSTGTIVSANKNFNDSLTDQWLTTEALNSTLGDYADASTDIGARATAAASDVKTFTQLMDVTKESIGSGWAQSFEILFGNFDQAKWLFSGLNKEIGKVIGDNADKRNAMLQGWKDLGGWGETIIGFDAVVRNLAKMFAPIKEAFRDIFPPMTSERLFEITHAFMLFGQSLAPSQTTVENIGRIFKGLFNVLSVGIDVIKFVAGAIKDFLKEVTGAGSGNALAFLAEIGDALANISGEKVVAGIESTFGKLIELLKWPIPYIEAFIDKIVDFAKKIDIDLPETGSIGEFLESIKGWFKDLGDLPDVGTPIANVFNVIKTALSDIGGFISGALSGIDVGGAIGAVLSTIGDAFMGIIDAIAGMFSAGGALPSKVQESAGGIDWETVMGVVGVAMTGGLIATINRLISNGINIDFTGGVLSSISDTFGQLTSTLKSMQQQIKADILLKIAAAIGVLALAMVGLSFIDPEKLVKSAVAIGVAFGEIAAAMKIMQKIEFSSGDAAKFTLMALGFGILAGAMVLLSGALLIIGTMDLPTLAKGMGVFAAMIAGIVVISKNLEDQAAGMVKAGVSMVIMAFAMDAMYGAIKKFGNMDLLTMVQGMAGLTASLALLVETMKRLPDDMKEKTTGVLGFSIALNLMVFAIKQLGEMDLGTLVQGGIAFAVMLGGLVLAMRAMPTNMAVTAGQFLALAGAMLILSLALKVFGSMSFGDMIQGLVGMAASLGILVLAMHAAESGIIGAGAILIMSAALLLLSVAIKAFAAIGFADFAYGMLLVVAAIGALALVAWLASEAIVPMMGIGAGLALIGLGFAAIGFGALQFAKAIAMLSGVEDIGRVIVESMTAVGKALPALFAGIAEGIATMVEALIGFIPIFVEFGVKLLSGLLDGLITVVPKLLEFIGVLVTSLIDLLITLIPQFATMGIEILLGILEGIRDTLPEIVTVVGEIITGFLDALAEQLPGIVESGVNLFATFVTSVAEGLGELMPTLMFGVGIAFMTGFFDGIGSVLANLWELIKSIGTTVIDTIKGVFGINSPSTVMLEIGIDLIMGLFNGIVETAQKVWDFFSKIAGEVLRFIGDVARTLWDKGKDLINGLWNGVKEIWDLVSTWLGNVATKVLTAIGNLAETLLDKGKDLLNGLYDGVKATWEFMKTWLGNLGDRVITAIGAVGTLLLDIGKKIINSLWDGMKEVWKDVTGWLGGLGSAIISKKGPPKEDAVMLYNNGKLIFQGLHEGMKDEWDNVAEWLSTVDPASEMDDGMSARMSALMEGMLADLDMSPVITPVIDLTNVRAGASTIGGLLGSNSYLQAGAIANSQQYTEDSIVGAGPTEIKFEQTINAPKQLSTADIYRQTRNQITMAKEELSIV